MIGSGNNAGDRPERAQIQGQGRSWQLAVGSTQSDLQSHTGRRSSSEQHLSPSLRLTLPLSCVDADGEIGQRHRSLVGPAIVAVGRRLFFEIDFFLAQKKKKKDGQVQLHTSLYPASRLRVRCPVTSPEALRCSCCSCCWWCLQGGCACDFFPFASKGIFSSSTGSLVTQQWAGGPLNFAQRTLPVRHTLPKTHDSLRATVSCYSEYFDCSENGHK